MSREILEGKVINNLYVEKYLGNSMYKCTCKLCEGTRECRSYELKLGKYKACKACELILNNKLENLKGKQFGYWKVLEYAGNKKWKCLCKHCNKEYTVRKSSLVRSKSCIKCSQELKIEEDFTKQKFKSGKVIRYINKSIWECTCGDCGKTVHRTTTNLKNTECILCNSCHSKTYRNKLEGNTINNWIVIKYLGNQKYLCKCNLCGEEKEVFTYNITSDHSKSCGCNQLISLKGLNINEWEVIEYYGNGYWKCRCSCGKEKKVHGYELRSNNAKSCGCKKWDYARKALLTRYKEVAPLKIKDPRDSNLIDTVTSAEKLEKFIDNLGYTPTTAELSKELNIGVSAILKYIHKYEMEHKILINSHKSKQHSELLSILYNYTDNIVTDDRKILCGKELDIYLPEYKLAFELNGVYWHSSIYKDKKYHQEKTIDCAKQGIRLIHIFEYEWENLELREKILSLIDSILSKDKKSIYARETEINQISNEECTDFLDMFHLQKSANSSVKLGCYYQNELIGVMTFGKPHFNNNYEYELHRFCWKPDIKVIGGAEKIFSYFIKNYDPQSIITYSDISKFTGNVYTRLGFKPIDPNPITEPNYVWVLPIKSGEFDVLTRYQTQKQKLLELGIGAEEQTEDEIMEDNGYLKIYNSGNIKLEWIR